MQLYCMQHTPSAYIMHYNSTPERKLAKKRDLKAKRLFGTDRAFYRFT